MEKQVFDHSDDDELSNVSSDIYRSVIGSLIYAAICTRPDLCWIVSKLSQFLNVPVTQKRWIIVKRVLWYIQGTKTQKLFFRKSPFNLTGFCDANWGEAPDRKSTTGYCFSLSESGTGMLTWKSRKQSPVALSSCEAEYVSMSNAVQEGMYLRQLLHDVFDLKSLPDVGLMCDNQGAMMLASKVQVSEKSKHNDIKVHFIRQCVAEGSVKLRYLPSKQMVADCLTKFVGRQLFAKFSQVLFGC